MKREALTSAFALLGVAGSGSGPYPCCAPAEAQARRSVAKATGLTNGMRTGRKPSTPLAAPAQDLAPRGRLEVAPLDLAGRQRPAEQIALVLVAVELAQD